MEPYRLRRWRRQSSPDAVAFFTCARPGRSKGKVGRVPDEVVDRWVTNLPGPRTAIVSLLGKKPNQTSEFSFYSFFGRRSFQEWLDHRHPMLSVKVIEHETTDLELVSAEKLQAVAADVDRLLSAGHTVVLVDSGGETRTGQVSRHLGFVEDPRGLPNSGR